MADTCGDDNVPKCTYDAGPQPSWITRLVVVRFATRVDDLTAGTQVLSHGRVRNTWQYRAMAGCRQSGRAAAVHTGTRGCFDGRDHERAVSQDS
jgi:hypothetical protein